MTEVDERVGAIGYGFFKAFLNEKKRDMGKFLVKNKVGFLPEGMDYSIYQKIKRKSIFKQLKFMIGNHPTLGIILAGIYISSLDKETKKRVMDENRQRIYDKYEATGVSIWNMGTTSFIEGYIKWLASYNLKYSPSRSELVDIYEGILLDWEEKTIFVQGSTNPKNVVDRVVVKMNVGKKVIFVFASGGAIIIVKKAIENLKKHNLFNENDYNILVDKLNNNEDERVWIIEKSKNIPQ